MTTETIWNFSYFGRVSSRFVDAPSDYVIARRSSVSNINDHVDLVEKYVRQLGAKAIFIGRMKNNTLHYRIKSRLPGIKIVYLTPGEETYFGGVA